MPHDTLWLPVLLSAVAVFVLSSILHMMLPWHRSDYPAMPNESAVMDALRPMAIPVGEYMVPKPSGMQAMKSPEFLDKMNRGPVFIMNVMPNGIGPMGRPLVLWFVYLVVVAALSGHVALGAMAGADHTHPWMIFHTVALSSLLGYTAALWQAVIWFRRPWMTALKSTIDGILYAVVTGLIFMWLWPK